MNVEHIKSGLLIVLIGLSIILTWQLYTYQPEIALLDVTTRYVSSELISEERTLSEVIQPDQIVVHSNNEAAMIPTTDPKFEKLYKKIINATYEDQVLIGSVPFPNRSERGGIEILFPSSIPSSIFFNMATIDPDYFYPAENIDRMYLYINEVDEQVYIQFLSNEEQQVEILKTNLSAGEFEKTFVEQIEEYIPVEPLSGERAYQSLISQEVYIPTERIRVDKLSFGASPLSVELFRQSLFTDPSAVKYYQQTDGEEAHTDGNRTINLRRNGLFMDYGNPLFAGGQDLTKHIVQGGYEFINGHGGWTDDYILSNWISSTNREEVTFRLHLNGFPVWSLDGQDLMTLQATRTGNQIVSYSRPLFDLDSLPVNVNQKIELPSGKEVIEYLQKDEFFDRARITKVAIGYEMKMANPSFVTVEPHWYVFYGSRWQKVSFEQMEGADNNGLE